MSDRNNLPPVRIIWDWGTGYDLFVSLHVLHNPEKFGLRLAWAAGVRSRLPSDERKFLAVSQEIIQTPLRWLYALPEPKDSAAVFWTLSRMPPAERLPALALSPDMPPEVMEILQNVSARRAWSETDLEQVRTRYQQKGWHTHLKALPAVLDEWARPDEFGEKYLQAMQTYHTVFFAEEERRIRPVLQSALARAQDLAERLSLPELVESLSQGVRFASLPEKTEVVLAPSYWSTPFIVFGQISPGCELMLFGGRPLDTPLVPGSVIPSSLVQSLKAMSDPTRLQILRYLAGESLTPSQLSRRLRLRAPTVTHHLNALRLAGLVQVTIESENEKRYATRPEMIAGTFDALQQFLIREV